MALEPLLDEESVVVLEPLSDLGSGCCSDLKSAPALGAALELESALALGFLLDQESVLVSEPLSDLVSDYCSD